MKEIPRDIVTFVCETCGQEVTQEHNNACHVCAMIAYLTFRHAFNWPLTAEDKVRLGLT